MPQNVQSINIVMEIKLNVNLEELLMHVLKKKKKSPHSLYSENVIWNELKLIEMIQFLESLPRVLSFISFWKGGLRKRDFVNFR